MSAGFGRLGSSLEALRTWDCLLRRGLLADLFLDLYPLVARFFVGLRSQLDPVAAVSAPTSDEEEEEKGAAAATTVHLELACGVLKVLQAAAGLVGWMEGTRTTLEFRHLADLQRLTGECLLPLMNRDAEAADSGKRLRLLSALMVTYATLEEASSRERGQSSPTDALRALYVNHLVPFLDSSLLRESAQSLSRSSALLSDLVDGRTVRCPANLPGVGAVCKGGALVPTAVSMDMAPSPFR